MSNTLSLYLPLILAIIIAIALGVFYFFWRKPNKNHNNNFTYTQQKANTVTAKQQSQNQKIEQFKKEADICIKSWGGNGVNNADREDIILFEFVHFMQKRKNAKEQTVFKSKYACAEVIMAACAVLEEQSNASIEEKMTTALSKYFDIQGQSIQIIPDRMDFYHRIYQKNGLNTVVEEICLIIPHDRSNNCLSAYDEDSPLMLMDFMEKMSIDKEVHIAMRILLGFINN